MKYKLSTLSLILVLSITSLFAQEDRERWFVDQVIGTVTDINKETRDITLVGQEGNMLTITAGEEVKRFDEIAVGDQIAFEYYTYIKAEFRRPTPEELAEPLVIIEEAGKAPDDAPPGAAVGAIVKAVVTIEALNRPFMTATVKGPQGNYTTLPVEDPLLLEQLNIGEIVILTYAEAMVVSLEKVGM